MRNNDILRTLRNILEASPARIAEIAALAGARLSAAEVERLLRHHDQPGAQRCSDEFLAQFLDGLIVHLRGRDDSRPPRPLETPITNNTVLKKLRVAFNLHDEDMHAIFAESDIALSKGELNALFRKPDNKHYRPCSDELLEAFLEGLAMSGYAPPLEGEDEPLADDSDGR